MSLYRLSAYILFLGFTLLSTTHASKPWYPLMQNEENQKSTTTMVSTENLVSSTPDTMTVDQLTELCILQKRYHDADKEEPSPEDIKDRKAFGGKIWPILAKIWISEENIALSHLECLKNDSWYPASTIPTIFFNPPSWGRPDYPNRGTRLIHIHGGPSKHISKTTRHAEITYYSSNGYRVICPNYSGSTGYDGWFKKCAKGKLPFMAVQDVYGISSRFNTTYHETNSLYTSKSEPNIVILRGGSFGSCISAHLAAQIHRGLRRNIIAGVHLMGGVKYPSAYEMPWDIPILIAHGCNDDISPFELGARFALQMLYLGHTNVQFIAAPSGDHHMISPLLNEPIECRELAELRCYLEASVKFIDDISNKRQPKFSPIGSQIRSTEELLKAMSPKAIRVLSLESRINGKRALLEMFKSFSPLLSLRSILNNAPDSFAGPTMSHLRLILGTDYVPNARVCLERFFASHFTPYSWTQEKWDFLRGRQILKDVSYLNQLEQMIYAEEVHLASHPDDMVIYHAAPEHSMRLYIFINMWRALLQGRTSEELSLMRLFDQQVSTFEDRKEFLHHMLEEFAKRQDPSEYVFNNIKGFPERAIAGLPSLIGSRHNTASCSMTWHWGGSSTSTQAPVNKIIAKLLKILGIYSDARVLRYQEMFELDQSETAYKNSHQSVMQQIFVPREYADNNGYMCQIWGVPLAASKDDLSNPSIVKELVANPVLFEEKLIHNKEAFTNPEEVEYEPGQHHYTDLLQLRMIMRPGCTTAVNSFFRDQAQAELFMERLQHEILWDFADFIQAGMTVPKPLMAGCQVFPLELRERLKMPFKGEEYSTYARYHFQKALNYPIRTIHGIYAGIYKNPQGVAKMMDGAARFEITNIQRRFIEKGYKEERDKICTYSVCKFLKGYTYDALLLEAIDDWASKIQSGYPRAAKDEHRGTLVWALHTFANPNSVNTASINHAQYEELERLFMPIKQYKRDLSRHMLISEAQAGIAVNWWYIDLENAVNSILRNAAAAVTESKPVKSLYKGSNKFTGCK